MDFTTTTERAVQVVRAVREGQLSDPTPMAGTDVTGAVHHLLGLTVAFRDAARKVDGPTTNTPPEPVAGPLPHGWREELSHGLRELARAWAAPAAWAGMTRAGGIELPGEVCGLIALDEVLLHGWDLAVATGQDYRPTEAEAAAVLPIVTPDPDPEQAAAEREGMFAPPLPVPAGASTWEQVLALSGRDRGWHAPA